jgi:hypothetical protein
MLHRYRALAALESIRVFRATLPPAADARPETLRQREALDSALRDFDIGSFVGLDAPLLLPETECQPAEWARARPARPFPEVLRGDTSRKYCTIVVKTLTEKYLTWRFDEAEAAPRRPGESIWAGIHVWQVKRLLHDVQGYPPCQIVLLFDDAGTWRTLNHPFLSLEAYGAFGAEILLQTSFPTERGQRDAQLPQLDWRTSGIPDSNLFRVELTATGVRLPRRSGAVRLAAPRAALLKRPSSR